MSVFSFFNPFRLFSLVLLFATWLKHSVLNLVRGQAGNGRREAVYVDASFNNGDAAGEERGLCGIGVWLPRRKVAIALKLHAATSMEAETLALLAGALAAKRFKIERPLIFSDCKSAVGTAKKLLHVHRAKGMRRQIARIASMSSSHTAHRHIYNALQGMDGTLEWRPREDNREADIASCIGSRIGHMGIRLEGRKERAHSLNDVLSLVETGQGEETASGAFFQKLRCGTETFGLYREDAASSAAFHRTARGLIGRISREVA